MADTDERKKRAAIALWDLATRDGATAKGVKAAMMKEGFSLEEIRAAVEGMA